MNLFAANTAFKTRKYSYTTTWTGYMNGKRIFNVIDFVMVQQKNKRFVIKARSYPGTQTESDHNMVLMNMNIPQRYETWTNRKKLKRLDFSNNEAQRKFTLETSELLEILEITSQTQSRISRKYQESASQK